MPARYFFTLTLLLFALSSCTPFSPQASPTDTAVPPTSTESPPTVPAPTETLEPTPTPTAKPTFAPPLAVTEPGQVWVNPVDGMEMVGVPAGEFTMGSNKGRDDEGPPHVIYLDAFYIDKFEVTNAQYSLCVDAGICTRPTSPEYFDDPDLEHHPIVNVTRAWAKKYCGWAGKRLPTEAEWEKVARGIDERTFPWGEDIDCEHAHYKECGGQTIPVGSKPKGASPYDAQDMAGNVWEWVNDRYEDDYYQNSPGSNPTGPETGSAWDDAWVIRGGSWSEDPAYVRTSYRSWYNPNARYYNLGFRCVRNSP